MYGYDLGKGRKRRWRDNLMIIYTGTLEADCTVPEYPAEEYKLYW